MVTGKRWRKKKKKRKTYQAEIVSSSRQNNQIQVSRQPRDLLRDLWRFGARTRIVEDVIGAQPRKQVRHARGPRTRVSSAHPAAPFGHAGPDTRRVAVADNAHSSDPRVVIVGRVLLKTVANQGQEDAQVAEKAYNDGTHSAMIVAPRCGEDHTREEWVMSGMKRRPKAKATTSGML